MRFPSPGEDFEGKYRIDRVIGSGGFARVYKAWESGLERPVALKILRPPSLEGQTELERDRYLSTLISRFEREGHLLSRLKSPHTVTVYSFGKSFDGLLYMALEFIDGQSLAELREDGSPLPPERAVKILVQVLLSLKEAHAMGMLHRDLKPANIMVFEHLGEPDHVKLLDFGIAKTFGETDRKDLTSDGTLIGTPRYMAPEQIQGNGIAAPSSDIYSLGLVAFELLTGERAITTDNSLQIIGQQMGPISFTVPSELGLPPLLRGVVNGMIDKNLSRRYQAVSEVLDDLADPELLSMVLNEPATMKLTAINASFPLVDVPDGIETDRSILAEEAQSLPIPIDAPSVPERAHKAVLGQPSQKKKRLLLGLALTLSVILCGLIAIAWARSERRANWELTQEGSGGAISAGEVMNMQATETLVEEEQEVSAPEEVPEEVPDEVPEEVPEEVLEEVLDGDSVPSDSETESAIPAEEPRARKISKPKKRAPRPDPRKFVPKEEVSFPLIE